MIIEEIRSGIDWFSGTLLIDSPKSADFVRKAQECLLRIAGEGNRIEDRSLLGYSGHSCGNCFIGTNQERHFVQFTGYHANDCFASVYRRDMHVSRIDVQVSVKLDIMLSGVAKKGYRDANTANSTLPLHRRRKIHIIIGSDGGDTLYVGSPSSEQRGRLYNKEVQSQNADYERTWRYEVVFKNDFATSVSNTLPFDTALRADRIRSLVALWYESRGVEAIWAFDAEAATLPLIKTLPSDVERKLLWIANQVAPTIKYLCDAGFGATLSELLPWLGKAPQE